MTKNGKSALRPEFPVPGDGPGKEAAAESQKKMADVAQRFSDFLSEMEGALEGSADPTGPQQMATSLGQSYSLMVRLLTPHVR